MWIEVCVGWGYHKNRNFAVKVYAIVYVVNSLSANEI